MSELTAAERTSLRARAHSLSPVVSIAGNGLTPAVLNEIDRSLKAHELIKIRTYGVERDQRNLLMTEICTTLKCAPVQQIGNLLVVYREKPAESEDVSAPPRAPKGRATKKQLSAGVVANPAPRRRAAQPATPAAPRRRSAPNPPRRANNTRGR